jgi:acyl-homoserine-lactone acylase
LEEEPLVKLAADNGAVLLDGSDPRFEWEVVDGARDPGLVPFSEMPSVEREDYVFNANDSFWMPHATEMLDGDYSVLHGFQETARTPRTRENATVLADTDADGPSGEDALFDLDELADASLANRGYTARELLEPVVERCSGSGPITVEPLVDDEGAQALPGAQVDLTEACEVLGAWDGTYDLDSVGPPVWREFLAGFESSDLITAGPLWANPFVEADPLDTPSGLASPAAGEPDPVLVSLARAVQTLDAADVSLDTPLGEVQVADRNGTLVPIHGGNGADGTTNVVGFGRGWSTLDPSLAAIEREPFAPNSSLATTSDGTTSTVGYRINNGTSFLMALEYTDDGPRAKSFLTYGNTADRDDPAYTEATQRFSDKAWRDILFREQDVAEATTDTLQVRG